MAETKAWGHNNSPKDRGSADRYYGRAFKPHYWQVNDDKTMARVGQDKMTEQQVAEYRYGFETEQDRDERVFYGKFTRWRLG